MTDDETRRARRAWIRDHHPDRGGDPAAFAEGLARIGRRGGGSPAGRPDRPSVRRTRRWRRALRRWLRTLLDRRRRARRSRSRRVR